MPSNDDTTPDAPDTTRIMFKTGGFGKHEIEELEVIKLTDKKVFYKQTCWDGSVIERSELKETQHHCWHDSWEAAKSYLIENARNSLENAMRHVDRCRSRLEMIQSLKPNVRDHRAGPDDPSKAGPTIVAGSGASTCWADVSPPDTTKEENQP